MVVEWLFLVSDKTVVTATAMLCITGLEATALFTGLDGAYFTLVIGVLGALAGVVLPQPKFVQTVDKGGG